MSSPNLTEPLSARTFLLGETADNTAEVLARTLSEQGVSQSPVRGHGSGKVGFQLVSRSSVGRSGSHA